MVIHFQTQRREKEAKRENKRQENKAVKKVKKIPLRDSERQERQLERSESKRLQTRAGITGLQPQFKPRLLGVVLIVWVTALLIVRDNLYNFIKNCQHVGRRRGNKEINLIIMCTASFLKRMIIQLMSFCGNRLCNKIII